MNCEIAHERIVLAAYGELADEQVHELERHLAICPECGQERDQVRALKTLAGVYAVAEPDANLVARARLRLEEALDALPPKGWLARLMGRVGGGFAALRTAPMAAGLLLLAGVGGGGLGGYEMAVTHAAHVAAPQQMQTVAQNAPAPGEQAVMDVPAGSAPAIEKVANITEIVRQPNSRMVEVRYNQLAPQRVKGSLDDPEIQQLLMLASQKASSEGVRDNSVELLAHECRAQRGCHQRGLRDALMVALRYGQDAGVREKALEGLEPYVAEDVRVRNAVLEALLNDSDPRIRTISINLLQPVEADTSVREVLYTVSTSDENPQIRNVSRQVLSQMPEIQ
ncbi:MAG: zf-HC2 domain-containing protein [Terracidiphilus sp.]|nr:zf-HC2 domain-containing protein [Terracidiphilus sp.]